MNKHRQKDAVDAILDQWYRERPDLDVKRMDAHLERLLATLEDGKPIA